MHSAVRGWSVFHFRTRLPVRSFSSTCIFGLHLCFRVTDSCQLSVFQVSDNLAGISWNVYFSEGQCGLAARECAETLGRCWAHSRLHPGRLGPCWDAASSPSSPVVSVAHHHHRVTTGSPIGSSLSPELAVLHSFLWWQPVLSKECSMRGEMNCKHLLRERWPDCAFERTRGCEFYINVFKSVAWISVCFSTCFR